MRTRIDSIADDIYRISTFIDSANLVFNQFLIDADEPLLFHCGTRSLFSHVLDAVLDLGGKRVRYLATPHVPHGWDAGLLFEETTRTLLCGDLFTRLGNGPAICATDPVRPALEAEDLFHFSAIRSDTAPTIQRLAMLAPLTLASMHGPAFKCDCTAALRALADGYAAQLGEICIRDVPRVTHEYEMIGIRNRVDTAPP